MTSEANEFDNVFFVVESNQQQVIFDMAFHKSIIIVGQFTHTHKLSTKKVWHLRQKSVALFVLPKDMLTDEKAKRCRNVRHLFYRGD